MATYFPIVRDGGAVLCFSCLTPTPTDPSTRIDSGYPTGRLRQTCPKCGLFTSFDIAVDQGAMTDAKKD